jgi:hypothetical protein
MQSAYHPQVRHKYLLGLALCVCVSQSGCGGTEAALVGKWTAVDAQSPSNPSIAEVLRPRLSKLTLELKPDRHFTFFLETGTWALDGDRVTLNISTMNGMDVQNPRKRLNSLVRNEPNSGVPSSLRDIGLQIGTLTENGHTLTLPIKPGALPGITFTFKKQ